MFTSLMPELSRGIRFKVIVISMEFKASLNKRHCLQMYFYKQLSSLR